MIANMMVRARDQNVQEKFGEASPVSYIRGISDLDVDQGHVT